MSVAGPIDDGLRSGGEPGVAPPRRPHRAAALVAALGHRAIVLVGMMGAGKTAMGRRLAAHLGLDFVDSDCEIEAAAGMTIADVFARHGEAYFRERESRVLDRLVRGGPRVVATGGGAFMHPGTRATLRETAVSLWIKAEFDVLMRRVRKRPNRPLLQTPDPEATLRRLMDERYPVYAEADTMVVSRDGPHEALVAEMVDALAAHLASRREREPAWRAD